MSIQSTLASWMSMPALRGAGMVSAIREEGGDAWQASDPLADMTAFNLQINYTS